MPCINVVVAGSGSTLHPFRGQTSILVDAGGQLLAVDLGCNALNLLARIGYEASQIEDVIVTHGHYDHYCGLPLLLFIKTFTGIEPRLNVYTVSEASTLIDHSIRGVRGFDRVKWDIYSLDPNERNPFNIGDVRVKPFPADHTVQTASITLEYNGLKITISSDTRPTSEFREEALNADLAIHEATFPSDMIEDAIASKHSTVSEALSQLANARIGMLYHISPLAESEIRAIKGKGLVLSDGSILKLC